MYSVNVVMFVAVSGWAVLDVLVCLVSIMTLVDTFIIHAGLFCNHIILHVHCVSKKRLNFKTV